MSIPRLETKLFWNNLSQGTIKIFIFLGIMPHWGYTCVFLHFDKVHQFLVFEKHFVVEINNIFILILLNINMGKQILDIFIFKVTIGLNVFLSNFIKFDRASCSFAQHICATNNQLIKVSFMQKMSLINDYLFHSVKEFL